MKSLIKEKKISVIQNFIKGKVGTNSITNSFEVINTKTKGNTIIFEPYGNVGLDIALNFILTNQLTPYLFILNDVPYTDCLNNISDLTFRGAYKKISSGRISMNLCTGVSYETMNFNNSATLTNCKGFNFSEVYFEELILENCFNMNFEGLNANKIIMRDCSNITISGINMPHNSIIECYTSSGIDISSINSDSTNKIRLYLNKSEIIISSEDKLLPNNILVDSNIEFKTLEAVNTANLFILSGSSSFTSISTVLTDVINLITADSSTLISISGNVTRGSNVFNISKCDNVIISIKANSSTSIFNLYRNTNLTTSVIADENTSNIFNRYEENVDSIIRDTTIRKIETLNLIKNVKLVLNNIAIKEDSTINFESCVDFDIKNLSIL